MFGDTVFIDRPKPSYPCMDVDGHGNMTNDMNIHRGSIMSIAYSYTFYFFSVSWNYFLLNTQEYCIFKIPFWKTKR